MSLEKIYLNDVVLGKSNKWSPYFSAYQKHLEKYLNRDWVTVLEIGVQGGGSLELWKKYFGKNSTIIGLDIFKHELVDKVEQLGGIDFFIGRQQNTEDLDKILDKYPEIDIVIDDGSHISYQQKITFDYLFPKIKDTATYIVEDLHTSFWPDHNGHTEKGNEEHSFFNYALSLTKEMQRLKNKKLWNFHMTRLSDKQLEQDFYNDAIERPNYWQSNLDSISFYESMIAFEKKPRSMILNMMIGHMR